MRKVIDVSGFKGRDEGKVFRITEMSAMDGFKFSFKVFHGMARGGVQVPDNAQQLGIVALLNIGLSGIACIPHDECLSLIEDLMGCIQIIPDSGNLDVARRLVLSDFEESGTIRKLLMEAFKLHADFIFAGDQ